MHSGARRFAEHGIASRLLGLIAVAAGVSGAYLLFLPELLVPGPGPLIMAWIIGFNVVAGVLLFAFPRRMQPLHVTLMISGDVIWATLRWILVDADLRSSPVFVAILAVTAGLLLERSALIVKMVLVVPALAVGLASTVRGAELVNLVLAHALVLNALTVLVYLSRRRIDALLAQVSALSNQDPLTRLPNRRHVELTLPVAVADATEGRRQLSAVVLDLDHFKRINDQQGHALGDEVLVGVAQRLRSATGERASVARLGGEEFLVIDVVDDPDDGAALASRLHAVVGAGAGPVPVTCSVGVATRPPPAGDVDVVEWGWGLVAQADQAMYQAKQTGRDRVVQAAADPGHVGRRGQTTSPPSRAGTLNGSLTGSLPGPRPRRFVGSGGRPGRPGCPTQRHPGGERDHEAGLRMVGRFTFWLGLLGLTAVLVNLLLTDLVPAGPGRTGYQVCAVYLAAVTMLMLIRPVAGARAMPLILLSGIPMWVVLQSAHAADRQTLSSAVTLLPIVAFAAWLTGPRLFAVHLLAVPVALSVALQGVGWSGGDIAVQAVTSSVTIAVVSLQVFWLRRRGERLVRAVEALSVTDPLTGLANRRHLDEHADAVVQLARRDRAKVAVLVIDMDHFKTINDSLGHAAGDQVLRSVGRALSGLLGPDDAAARIGGEELMLLAAMDGERDALARAEQVRRSVEQQCNTDAGAVTCSIGVAVASPPDHVDPVAWVWELYAVADRALYRAKEQGRNRVVAAWHQAGDLAAEVADEVMKPDGAGQVPVPRAPSAISYPAG
jgi:diguanylate cyclase (GGDEF)-like protein